MNFVLMNDECEVRAAPAFDTMCLKEVSVQFDKEHIILDCTLFTLLNWKDTKR